VVVVLEDALNISNSYLRELENLLSNKAKAAWYRGDVMEDIWEKISHATKEWMFYRLGIGERKEIQVFTDELPIFFFFVWPKIKKKKILMAATAKNFAKKRKKRKS
jgi:hypothetical protein